MVLPDVNVLVYAHRADVPGHAACRRWIESVVNGPEAFGIAEVVLAGFLRVVTNPRIFGVPSKLEDALAFVHQIREQPNCVVVSPGPRHFGIFVQLCRAVRARGDLIPDAYLAALAIESGCLWVTADRGFARFPGLKWQQPQT
jgi:hypothetical protein